MKRKSAVFVLAMTVSALLTLAGCSSGDGGDNGVAAGGASGSSGGGNNTSAGSDSGGNGGGNNDSAGSGTGDSSDSSDSSDSNNNSAGSGSSGSGGSGGSNADNSNGSNTRYAAAIRTTSFGIPHVKADDYASLGYGLGYAEARDNLCVLAMDYLTINGRRAEFFGTDGGYSIPANGAFAKNVDSDFFWRSLLTDKRVQTFEDAADPEAVAASRGFAAGYSRYVRELAAGEHPGRNAACRDADWVRPITVDDMFRRYIRLGVLASSSVFPTEIATAAPPATGEATPTASNSQIVDQVDPADFPFAEPLPIGSNMYGLGPEATQNGQPILFGNPHFPWTSPERLYQMQLTIPGKANIFGSSLYGVPAVLIGFNRHFAWSHTVSTAYRFTFYELKLDPSDPTRYLFDGRSVPMDADQITIEVKQDDGSLVERKRTLYRSRFGPMLELSVSGVPVLPWTNDRAYTLRDANLENTRLIRQFFKWNQAHSLDEFIRLHASVLGIPWVNTVATGPGQPAYYGDVSVVPNVPDSKVQNCQSSVSQAFAQLVPGLPVLDGSRSQCDWDTDADAAAPGIFGPSNLPTLVRRDAVSNNNDSYWLTNPAEPLTGFARIIGSERTERSLRTRLSLLQIQRRLNGGDGLPGTKFNLDNLKQIVLDSHIYSGELARDDVESDICASGTVVTTSGPVDVSRACQVLADWDLAANLDSVGAHIWREFWTRADDTSAPFWLTPFDPNDPVNTPNTLNTANPQIRAALGDAVKRIKALGIALDAPMGDLQHSGIHDEFIPIFGDLGNATGSFTVAGGAPLDKTGYPVLFGNSYIQAVTWAPGCTDSAAGCKPIAQGFVTYSQSTDPANPHYKDETKRYSKKQWIKYPFTEDEIKADPNLVSEHIRE